MAAKPKWMTYVDQSFLSNEFKEQYKQLIMNKFEKLF